LAKRTVKKSVAPSSLQDEVKLSEEAVFDVLRFTNAMYQTGAYTPDLLNSRMKDITLSPQIATSDKINQALQSPKDNEQQLVGYSEFLELNSMLYKRILLYFSGLLSFDMLYVCTNADEDDYDKPAYKKDLAIVRDFFDRFNIKESFKVVMKELLRAETFYGVFREDGERYIIQELPQQYAKLTGRWDYGLLYDFNMYWFVQPAVSLDMYPPVFKKMYNKAFKDGSIKYNPAAGIDSRMGNWTYWVQTSPKDGFVAFKLFPEIAANVPFLAPYMPDAVIQPVIRELQTNSYIAEASKIIFGQVEFLKDSTAKVKDSLTLTPETLGKFLALVKSALPSAIKVAAAPLANTSAMEFSGNTEIYDSYLSTSASSSGINSRLIYSKDRQNLLETKLSVDIDQNIVKPVYSQMENMLNFYVNRKTKRFKFKFMLEGFETGLDRDSRLEKVSALAEQGIVLYQKYASALGMNPFDFERMLAEGRGTNFVKKLTPILKSSQMSKESQGGKKKPSGRPAKPDSELGESGEQTRADTENEEDQE